MHLLNKSCIWLCTYVSSLLYATHETPSTSDDLRMIVHTMQVQTSMNSIWGNIHLIISSRLLHCILKCLIQIWKGLFHFSHSSCAGHCMGHVSLSHQGRLDAAGNACWSNVHASDETDALLWFLTTFLVSFVDCWTCVGGALVHEVWSCHDNLRCNIQSSELLLVKQTLMLFLVRGIVHTSYVEIVSFYRRLLLFTWNTTTSCPCRIVKRRGNVFAFNLYDRAGSSALNFFLVRILTELRHRNMTTV